ncbi:MAG: GGDEF domain-containing protein [Acidobacteria bacterium]|nr:GGDEF domain-containing protein [Acidobacteriota bacterium]
MAEASPRTTEARAVVPEEYDSILKPHQTEASPVDELLRRFHAIDEQDSGIWAKNVLVAMVLLAGFLSFVYPHVMWDLEEVDMDPRYLPQFFFGLTALVVLYNAYLLDQRRKLLFAREEMIRQILRAESSETMSLLDPLTQVYNRRYLDKILRLEMSRADRLDTTLAVMMIDLDGFKAINTDLGHVAGDQVLREVAQLLNRVFRRSDTVLRYGGDEFLVLMPESDEEQASHAVTRLAQRVSAWTQKAPGPARSLGISCGVATYRKGGNIQDVIRIADENLYAQKTRHHADSQDAVKTQNA